MNTPRACATFFSRSIFLDCPGSKVLLPFLSPIPPPARCASAVMMLSVAAGVFALLVAPPATRRPALDCHEVWLQPATAAYSTGQAIEQSEVLLVVPGLATGTECATLSEAARRCAEALGGAPGADLGAQPTGRIPSIAAAARATRAGVECVAPLPAEADSIADSLLARVFALIDAQYPSIVSTLFGPDAESMLSLYEAGALNYHSREPAVNVYDAGGEFLPHMVRHLSSAPLVRCLHLQLTAHLLRRITRR